MSDNYIGNPASGTPTFASQASVEAAAVLDQALSPGNAKFHPGIVKAAAKFTAANPAVIVAGFGITSIVRTGPGTFLVTLATPFSSANYVVVFGANNQAGIGQVLANVNAQTPGTFEVLTGTSFAALTETNNPVHFACLGDLP